MHEFVLYFKLCAVGTLFRKGSYSNQNPTNNLVAYDFDGNKIWEIDDIIRPLAPQTIVSMGKKDCRYVNGVSPS